MSKVAIVCDSCARLPRELEEEYEIKIIPLRLIFEGKTYRDREDITAEEFYPLLEQLQELPTTSGPPVLEYIEAFRKLSREATGVLCLTITQGFSRMTWEAAQSAKELAKHELPGFPIEIIDSGTVCGAYGLIVLAAARAAARGQSLPRVVEAAQSVRSRVTLIAVMDTLKYLEKGGRIGKAASWAGSLLDIKPIIEVPPSTGVVEPIQRVRGKARAVRRLLDIMRERVGTEKPLHVIVDHGNVPQEAQALEAEVLSRFKCIESYITCFAPVAGVHTGPGLLGLSFYTEP